jgi:outer membrane receptor for ferrienterochelin and colicins
MKKTILIFTISLLIILPLKSGHALKTPFITVLDSETGEPISYATITYYHLKTHTTSVDFTSDNGIVKNKADGPSKITISYLGYKTIVDTLSGSTLSKTYYMESDAFLMDQVVVTATRSKKMLKDTPVITQVISSDQIQAFASNTVSDALETEIPGIEFQRFGPGTAVNIQGLEGKNVLVLIDGEKMAGETRGNVDYWRLNTNDVERVEIVKGASSALYGSQAMGAVINVIPKKFKTRFFSEASFKYTGRTQQNFPSLDSGDDQYDFKRNLDKPNLNVNALFGFNFEKFSSKTNVVFKSMDAYRLQSSGIIKKDYIDIDTVIFESANYVTGIEGQQDYTISQNFSYRASPTIEFKASGSFYSRHKYDFSQDNKHEYFEDLTIRVKGIYTPSYEQTIQFSFHTDTYSKFDYLERLNKKDDKNYQHRFLHPKLLINTILAENHVLTGGLEYLHESLVTDMFNPEVVMEEKQAQNVVAFIQDDVSIASNINAVVGLRALYHDVFGSEFLPKLSLMAKWRAYTLRLNYAHGYRAPNLKELYSNWSHFGMFTIVGDENLKPETNRYFSASLELTNNYLNTSLTAYHNSFKDKISGIWIDNQTFYNYRNFNNTRLFGIDLLVQFNLRKRLKIKGGYSYVDEHSDDQSHQLSSVSPHTATLKLGYHLFNGWYDAWLNFSGKYIGEKNFNVLDNFEYRGNTTEAYYPKRYEGYAIWNLSYNQNFGQGVHLVTGIDNLFDYTAKEVTFNTSITPGRSYYSMIRLDLDNLYRTFLN